MPALDPTAPRVGATMAGGSWTPSSVDLFLFSAATYNSHRIHYDADYARREEGHEGLVVHGPLQATRIADGILGWFGGTARLTSLRCRHLRPAYAGAPLELRGEVERVELPTVHCRAWLQDGQGELTTVCWAVVTLPASPPT